MTLSAKQYQLEKSVFTEEDFEDMNWHDSFIYGISFADNFKLHFDIDYIFKWVLTGKKYKFWIAPCTLVFENVYDIIFDLEMSSTQLDIDGIKRENPQRPKNADYIKRDTEFDWTIQTQQGIISFKSVGYKQYVRRLPEFLNRQIIGKEARDGISFNTNEIEI
jgi:hypothetical protein